MRRRREILIGAIVLAALVLGVFGQTARHPFITYDDPFYLTQNPVVLKGLTGEGLRWAFGIHIGNWHPLTWFSHMADVQLFGLNAGYHHLVSVLLHAGSTVLLFVLLRSLTGAFWMSLLAAAVFGIHPLRVESVAWASERKDVLSTLFWFLALTAWLGYVRRPGMRRYVAAVALFALGLAAKPMVMTLPAVLLLLDWWPLGRLPGLIPGAARTLNPRTAGGLLLEKVPFVLLASASLAATIVAQTRDATEFVNPGLLTRAANAIVSCAWYVVKFVWPADLAILYPYPVAGIPPWQYLAGVFFLVAVTAAVLLAAHRLPCLAVGWFWYLVTLAPVIGLFQVGAQARADRYTYIPLVGVTMALVWLLGFAASLSREARMMIGAIALTGVVCLAGAAFLQVTLWRDGITLYRHTLAVTSDNKLIQYNLATDYKSFGRNREAIAAYQEVLRIDPRHANAYNNLGDINFKAGLYAEAAAMFGRASSIAPSSTIFHFNLGMALARLGRKDEALKQWRIISSADVNRARRLYPEIFP